MTHADSIWAKALELHSDSLQNKVDSLQAKFDALHGKTEFLSNIIETANDGVSNQLSTANYLLALVAVVIAIVAIWLGIYIGNKKKEIELMAKTIDETKDAVTKIAKDTENLDKKVHSNLSDLYKDLRKEETNTIINRLVEEPSDISNLIVFLATRVLSDEYYPLLREAYLNLPQNPDGVSAYTTYDEYRDRYILLFFQHYIDKAVKDDAVRPRLLNNLVASCKAAFKSDIIKTTIDLSKALSDESSSFNKEDVLTQYLKALNNSDFKGLVDLKNILEQNITPSSLLQNAINKCTADHVYLQLFGINPPEDARTESQKVDKK